MKRWTMLGLVAVTVACGGRTTLDDSIGADGAVANDGGVITKDATTVDVVGPPIGDAMPPPPPSDASPPPPPLDGGPGPGIHCGGNVCTPNETCCVTYNNQTLNETCTAPNQCQGAQFDCSGTASCPPGEVCCGSFSQQSQGASCAPACQGGFQNPQLCDNTAECTGGLTCKPTPFGFKVCRP